MWPMVLLVANGVVAAAPLDLSNWMAALEPIVGNNTLLDLSVSSSSWVYRAAAALARVLCSSSIPLPQKAENST